VGEGEGSFCFSLFLSEHVNFDRAAFDRDPNTRCSDVEGRRICSRSPSTLVRTFSRNPPIDQDRQKTTSSLKLLRKELESEFFPSPIRHKSTFNFFRAENKPLIVHYSNSYVFKNPYAFSLKRTLTESDTQISLRNIPDKGAICCFNSARRAKILSKQNDVRCGLHGFVFFHRVMAHVQAFLFTELHYLGHCSHVNFLYLFFFGPDYFND